MLKKKYGQNLLKTFNIEITQIVHSEQLITNTRRVKISSVSFENNSSHVACVKYIINCVH